MIGIITFESGKGYYFAETDDTHQSIFLHQNFVKDNRVLHVGDRVRFNVEPNPRKPGSLHGASIEYLAHIIARQVSDARGGSHE
jgi:cold shock CspA family protein